MEGQAGAQERTEKTPGVLGLQFSRLLRLQLPLQGPQAGSSGCLSQHVRPLV